jgi:hypothetical protein
MAIDCPIEETGGRADSAPTRSKPLERRRWAIGCTVVSLGFGMAYMFYWNPLVHHNGSWSTGGDLWGIYRGAHYVAWGYLGGIYTNGTGIVAFPGMSVLLAPVAFLTGKLHMSESYAPYFLVRPTAALILQPLEVLLGATVIFASDAVAERLGASSRRRAWLCVVVTIVMWPACAVWGHAEDLLALTFALYAMIALMDRKWSKMGWLFGLGVAMQPLVLLLLPLFIGASPRGKRLLLAVRSTVLSVVLIVVAFLGDAADTYRALVAQPTPPSVNHPTPWVWLAPKVSSDAVTTVHGAALVGGLGHASITTMTVTGRAVVMVSGGPGRMLDVALAVMIGLYVWRKPQPLVRVFWLAALVLVSRCFFEPVMTPYYLAPPLILCITMAVLQRGKRFWPAVVLSLEVTVLAYFHLNPWVWWLPIVCGLIGILALAYPSDLGTESSHAVWTDKIAAVLDTDPSAPSEAAQQPVFIS